jgi:uncharacterized membrane protein YfcA
LRVSSFLGGGVVGLVGWGGAQVIIPGMTHPTMAMSQLSATGISLSSLSVSVVTSGFHFLQEDRVALETALAIAAPSILSARLGTILAHRISGEALSLIFNGSSLLLIPTHFFIQERKRRRQHKQQQQQQQQQGDEMESETEPDQDGRDTSNNSIQHHNNPPPPAPPPHHHHQQQQQPKGPPTPKASNNEPPTKFQATFFSIAKQQQPANHHLLRLGDENKERLILQHATYGILSGLISSLMGVGGLPLTMSYLTECTDLPHHVVQGTALCALVPSIVTSAVSRRGAIPLRMASLVAGGAVVGGWTGSQIALQTSEEQLRQFYMMSLIVFGSRSMMAAGQNVRNLWRLRSK